MFKDFFYYINEWIDLNKDFYKTTQKAFHYPKVKNIEYNQGLYDKIHRNYSPVFVLSTGRCGTLYLSKILDTIHQVDVYHKPKPELIYYSKYAYENYLKYNEIIGKIFDAARYEYIQESYLRKRIFIETNSRITYFACAIAEMFPKAKFIHLVRNPADFVRSGIRRNWYGSNDVHSLGRIEPINNTNLWNKMSQFEQICWLWNETNEFIELFKQNYTNNQNLFMLKSEDMFHDEKLIIRLLEFCNISDYDPKLIRKKMSKPVNAQKTGTFPEISEWTSNQKESCRKHAPLYKNYGYTL